MATRQQVLALRDGGLSYEEVGRRLGIDAGLAFMVATGLPADGSDTLTSAERSRPGFVETSTQHLASTETPENPTRKQHVLDWVKARARADAQMREAAARRTAAPGEVENPDDENDFASVLTRDHDRVTALLQQLSTIPGHKKGGSPQQIERRKSIVDLVRLALSRHEAAEQQLLWPTVRRVLPGGDARAEQALGQEQEGADTLAALGKAEPGSDEFDEFVEQLVLRARQHVAFEDQVFLDLKQHLDRDEQADLGAKFLAARKTSPEDRAKGPRKRAAVGKEGQG